MGLQQLTRVHRLFREIAHESSVRDGFLQPIACGGVMTDAKRERQARVSLIRHSQVAPNQVWEL